MRVVVVGASGNVGTALLERFATESSVTEVVGVARRVPGREPPYEQAEWYPIDVGAPDAVDQLGAAFTGATAVVHLAWQIQPSHDRARLRRTNVLGTTHVARAAIRAGVPTLVVASSVGAYAPAPSKDRRVGEDWPVTGVPGSTYSRDKADVEAMLDELEREYPPLRVVRLRPGLIFQRRAASEIARYFIGPLAPLGHLRFGRLPIVPSNARLRVQAVHAEDVADAYLRAVLSDVRGPFNIAAEPVLDPALVAARFGGMTVPVPPPLMLLAAELSWHARLQPSEPGWIRLATAAPLLSCARAESELGWRPRHDAMAAFAELIDGMAGGTGTVAPVMRPRGGPTRGLGEIVQGRLPGHGDPY